MEFKAKVAVITGGAQGIGRACALYLAREGAAVVIADRDAAASEAVVAGIQGWGGHALAVTADVSDEAGAARIAQETVAAFDGIDILINNAGITAAGSVESTTLERWSHVIATNLTSVYLVSRFAIPEMRRRGGGAIVNLGSIHGLSTGPNYAAYAASKGGVIALTRTMALDYAAEGIRVNCVCPGIIATSLLDEAARVERANDPEAQLQAWAKLQPIGRAGSAEEVAELICFLASPRSSLITGGIYTIDGGLSATFGTGGTA